MSPPLRRPMALLCFIGASSMTASLATQMAPDNVMCNDEAATSAAAK